MQHWKRPCVSRNRDADVLCYEPFEIRLDDTSRFREYQRRCYTSRFLLYLSFAAILLISYYTSRFLLNLSFPTIPLISHYTLSFPTRPLVSRTMASILSDF